MLPGSQSQIKSLSIFQDKWIKRRICEDLQPFQKHIRWFFCSLSDLSSFCRLMDFLPTPLSLVDRYPRLNIPVGNLGLSLINLLEEPYPDLPGFCLYSIYSHRQHVLHASDGIQFFPSEQNESLLMEIISSLLVSVHHYLKQENQSIGFIWKGIL